MVKFTTGGERDLLILFSFWITMVAINLIKNKRK
jgi:hypothetical protein